MFLLSLDACFRCIVRLIVLLQDHADSQVELGNLCASSGAVDEAIEWYTLAATGVPRHIDALYNLGSIYYNQAMTASST
jgi:TPR repeat protein